MAEQCKINQRQEMHSDKVWTDITTQNTFKYHQTYLANLPNWPKYLGYFWVSIVGVSSHLISVARLATAVLGRLGIWTYRTSCLYQPYHRPAACPLYKALHTTKTIKNKREKLRHRDKAISDIPFMIQSHA